MTQQPPSADDHKLPEPPPEPPPEPAAPASVKDGFFAGKAVMGFILVPIGLVYLIVLNSGSALPFFTGAGAVVLMLFFRRTRAFALGGVLSVGVLFMLLVAICGNMNI